MIKTKKIGIWMDHSVAHLIEFSTDLIESKFDLQIKEGGLAKSEHVMHNKEQDQQHEYYKNISDIIKDYDEVLLFGPTDAKTELLNMLKEDHHFDKVRIATKQTDKMTNNQQRALVKEFFEKN
ncbi:hypothetical protein ACQ33O_03720 [Ferruginibacter sp. SUN002]|uniref:hypothetical protein n=1 Tax=Ferruginibacter sp. SUN002 TaxID=2937789 RepID=UPI003D36A6C1